MTGYFLIIWSPALSPDPPAHHKCRRLARREALSLVAAKPRPWPRLSPGSCFSWRFSRGFFCCWVSARGGCAERDVPATERGGGRRRAQLGVGRGAPAQVEKPAAASTPRCCLGGAPMWRDGWPRGGPRGGSSRLPHAPSPPHPHPEVPGGQSCPRRQPGGCSRHCAHQRGLSPVVPQFPAPLQRLSPRSVQHRHPAFPQTPPPCHGRQKGLASALCLSSSSLLCSRCRDLLLADGFHGRMLKRLRC